MAHFAELDENNIVLRVLVIGDDLLLDENGEESEEIGKQVCADVYGGRWIQTSYNSKIRRRYAVVGGKYDEEKDAFLPRHDFPSWTLNEETLEYEPPVAFPGEQFYEDGTRKTFIWNEDALEWQEFIPQQDGE